MTGRQPQSIGQSEPPPLTRRCSRIFALCALAALAFGSVGGADEGPLRETPAPGTFLVDSPVGEIRYEAGRGVRFGETGLVVGGFATAEGERLETGESRGSVEGVNFLLFYEPLSFVRIFSEIEVGDVGEWESGRSGFRSDPAVDVDRLYGELGSDDRLGLRVGKFLTPIGRWSPVPAEPFVWTASEPLIVEEVFDEAVTGAMATGRVFGGGGAFSYSAYGTFLDPIAPDVEAPPAEHSAGVYLEWASLGGWSVGGSYFASEAQEGGDWNHLGGVDGLWQATDRLELSGEALFGEGTREEGFLWGMYAQAVVETLPTLYAVGRYERFDPPGRGRAVDLVDVGLAWVPVPYLRVKADYRIADHDSGDFAEPGLRSSLSLLF